VVVGVTVIIQLRYLKQLLGVIVLHLVVVIEEMIMRERVISVSIANKRVICHLLVQIQKKKEGKKFVSIVTKKVI